MSVEIIGHLIDDPDLKGIEKLTAPDGPGRFARAIAAELTITPHLILTVLKQRVGQRALIRIDAPRETEPHRWYVKLRRKRRGGDEESHRLLTCLSEEAHKVGVTIPRPVAYLPRYRATIYEAAPGVSLLPCCAPRDAVETGPNSSPLPAGERGRVFGAVGRALASLHETLPRPENMKPDRFELEQVGRARKTLLTHRADLAGRFDDTASVLWKGQEGRSDRQGDESVALHGDFYPGQVLIRRSKRSTTSEISILDWDNLCAGEAERDAANFTAHLELERLRGHLGTPEAADLVEAFYEGYDSIRPLRDSRLLFYRQASLLRLACLYSDPAFGPSPPNDPDLPDRLLDCL